MFSQHIFHCLLSRFTFLCKSFFFFGSTVHLETDNAFLTHITVLFDSDNRQYLHSDKGYASILLKMRSYKVFVAVKAYTFEKLLLRTTFNIPK